MARKRINKSQSPGASVPMQDSSNDVSPVVAYRNLVMQSSSVFRADVEFHEKPRQVVFGATLVSIVAYMSYINTNNEGNWFTASRFAVAGCAVAIVMYAMLQTKDGLMVCFGFYHPIHDHV